MKANLVTAWPVGADAWPALPLDAWRETYHNLHMWSQMVGKVEMELTPVSNHWWNVSLHVTPRGLTTTPIPYGAISFEIQFDFVEHKLTIDRSDGVRGEMALRPLTVAEFRDEFFALLSSIGVEVEINGLPCEVPNPVPFAEDNLYRAYDRESAERLHRILLSVQAVFQSFRARFVGKNSPVQFFWGSFDLAVTRFNGLRAPERPGADAITREAYSHEVISAGWWPGGSGVDGPAFYCYAAPAPEGLAQRNARPAEAFYHAKLGEFILMYDDVRRAASPAAAVMEFLQSTYEAAAELAHWNRGELERGAFAA